MIFFLKSSFNSISASSIQDFEQSQHDKKAAKEKKSRLIIRNLSFKATDDKIKSHFSTYGDVVDVNILKKKDGKMVGCAFIQYSNIQEASMALKNLNGKPFLQRPIAIDWAVPKDQFQQSNPKPNAEEKEEEEVPDMVSDPLGKKILILCNFTKILLQKKKIVILYIFVW